MYKQVFAERLREARRKSGFTQEEVSRETNIPRSTLANYELGRTEPDIENLGILIDFYEEEAHYILGTRK